MRVGLLGPLMLTGPDGASVVPPPQQRVVIAGLALRAGQVVSLGELVGFAWEGKAPDRARVVIRNYVLRLRRLLGGDGARLRTRSPGYLLAVSEDDVDALAFIRLCEAGIQAGRSRSWGVASGVLGRALGLWRGVPLADVPSAVLHQRWDAHLEGLRLQAAEWRARARLELGEDAGLVPELDLLAARCPLREQVHELRLLALYRAGRQGEALAAYQQARQVLAAELGVHPGPGLQRLHQQILAHDPALAPAPDLDRPPGPARAVLAPPPEPAPPEPAPVSPAAVSPAAVSPAAVSPAPVSLAAVPRQLPAAVPGFAGRAAELAALAALADQAAAGQAVVIAAIAGTAGAGKTTLAVRFAHQVAGQFPGGQLYADLRGAGPARPVTPAQALHGFLTALGIGPARIPAGLDARAGLYRTLLAGRRMLIVLDNTRDASQIRPLIPGTAGTLVLTTSRNHLTAVASAPTHLIALDLLTRSEAGDLLAARLGADVITGQAKAVAELIRLCGRLPLALAVSAALAAAQPGRALADLAAKLRDARNRLDILDGADPASSVRAIFSWSYQRLTMSAARMFRLLSIHPGPDISAMAATSLAGVGPGEARRALAELTMANLLTEPVPGRYAPHDLLRIYASELAGATDSASDRRAAILRTLDHYTQSASNMSKQKWRKLWLAAPVPGVTPETIADGDHMAWFDAERKVVRRLVDLAVAEGLHNYAWRLPWSVAMLLEQRGDWQDWAAIQRSARMAAERAAATTSSGPCTVTRGSGIAGDRLAACEPRRLCAGAAGSAGVPAVKRAAERPHPQLDGIHLRPDRPPRRGP
jgi:DNA-binding SARP family transcriptional activator